jgi:EF hand
MSVLGTTKRILLVTAALLAPALALAQPPGPPDDAPPPPRGRRGAPAEGPGDEQPRRPGPPIMAALDTDRDGELSPEEIRNAAAALKSLDHNNDGRLDRSELAPDGGRPEGPDGPPPGGPDGPPPRRAGGLPEDGPPRGTGPGRPAIGRVLPPFVRGELALSARQQKQIAELENSVKSKLESILTLRQLRQLRDRLERGPGGPAPRPDGPGGRNRGGPPPGAGAPDQNDEPPVRPRRP